MTEPNKPPAGFGKGVNGYLNDYVKVADAKATAFLAANLAAATLVLRLEPAIWLPLWCRGLSLVSLGASACFCAWVVFPRLPSGRMGVVFWEDIRRFKSAELYERELQTMDDMAVESEYASQNWFVSSVVHDKFAAVQRAIVLFFAGVALAVLGYLTLP
jgi:hypothetical protein